MAESQCVRVRVPGKINLALCVGPRRDDGFHDLATVFQSVSLFDELGAAPAPDGVVTVAVDGPGADLVGAPRTTSRFALPGCWLTRTLRGGASS
ncbi:hypothetical protein [Raineyella fluvialis]|uniref:hypothetical protein n=1 Tax=Raineyella fluvialis TaxID=2662261 RepID=UPI001E57C335|nr:hypothetical protein [Raineyella fluvialis]